ncbi:hypothetical protein GYMLUDRAFT_935550 [Collybiopsis luxurians FD-317 M1]|nr:hypothetical protein GYMLUDRAFT_935550 [Collybiopsis luxurians FD-317 M1]
MVEKSKRSTSNIYAQTNPNWQLAHTYFSIPSTIATKNDTLSESSLLYLLSEPSCIKSFANTVTQSNLVASTGALLGHHLTYDDSRLAYPLLAYVFKYIVGLIMLFVGMTTGYGRLKSLTSPSSI